MITLAAALLLTSAPLGQTAPQSAPPADLTRSLNSGPPRPAVYLAPEPEPEPEPEPTPTPAPAPTPSRPVETPVETPVVAPVVAPVEAPAPAPSAPAVTVLDAAARAALPFTLDLPAGFDLVTGRPGPDFRIYTVRRGDQSFAMIYAGPASQFPIYSGQMVEAAGRASVVSTEDGRRHAREHLFQRPTAPREVHIWTMSLDGPDRALAERIAQTLDVR